MTQARQNEPGSGLAIDLSNVEKVYAGRIRALRGIDMRVHSGEVFGLLGPNGAGKSTLVKILLTVIRPTRATGTVLGRPIGHKPTLSRVGYLPEHHRFPDYLTGAQVVDFYGAMSGTPRPQRRRRTAELLALVDMSPWANKRVRSYSKGMRQRIGIAQALVNDPDLIVLDEPTDGVDPVGRRDIRGILQRLRDQGKTVFLNSHLLSELEMICDRVAILVQGLVAQQGTLDELTHGRQYFEFDVAGADGVRPADLFRRALPGLLGDANGSRGTLATGEVVELAGDTLRAAVADPAKVQGIIDALRAQGVTIRTIRLVRPSLEDLFMQAVTDPTTGETLATGAANSPPRRQAARAGGVK